MKTRSLKFLLLINGKIPCTCIHVNNYLSVTMGDYGKLHYKSFSVESDVNELKENQEANRRKIESIYSSIQYQKCANILGFLTLLFSSGFISYLYLQINGFDHIIQDLELNNWNRIGSIRRGPVSNAPIGTILAWVPKPENTSSNILSIPDGWMPCDGSPITQGQWKGGRTPDLNSVGAFLRGGTEDLVLEMEDSQIEDHQHDYNASYIMRVY